MNLTISQTSLQTWKAVRRHYFSMLSGAVLLIAATAAGVGALATNGTGDSATNILPPAAPPISAGQATQATAPITYYLVDSEEAAQIWAAEINAEVSEGDGVSYFLAPGMSGFDEAVETLGQPASNASVMDLRGR
jgi:hypothetical protein